MAAIGVGTAGAVGTDCADCAWLEYSGGGGCDLDDMRCLRPHGEGRMRWWGSVSGQHKLAWTPPREMDWQLCSRERARNVASKVAAYQLTPQRSSRTVLRSPLAVARRRRGVASSTKKQASMVGRIYF